MRRMLPLLLLPLFARCSAPDALGSSSGSCQGPQAYAVGSTASSKLGDNECRGPGDIDGHLYRLSLTSQSNFSVSMVPSGFEGSVGVWTSAGKVVFETNGSGAFGAKVFLPAGEYVLVAGRYKASAGSYTLTTAPTTVTDCSDSGPGRGAWSVPGASISGTVTNTDCGGNGVARQDIYTVWMAAGQTLTVSASMNQPGTLLVSTSGGVAGPEVSKPILKGGSASVTYSAPSAAAYNVHLLTEPSLTGPATYTVSIS